MSGSAHCAKLCCTCVCIICITCRLDVAGVACRTEALPRVLTDGDAHGDCLHVLLGPTLPVERGGVIAAARELCCWSTDCVAQWLERFVGATYVASVAALGISGEVAAADPCCDPLSSASSLAASVVPSAGPPPQHFRSRNRAALARRVIEDARSPTGPIAAAMPVVGGSGTAGSETPSRSGERPAFAALTGVVPGRVVSAMQRYGLYRRERVMISAILRHELCRKRGAESTCDLWRSRGVCLPELPTARDRADVAAADKASVTSATQRNGLHRWEFAVAPAFDALCAPGVCLPDMPTAGTGGFGASALAATSVGAAHAAPARSRIAVLGGSFSPVTSAHLTAATNVLCATWNAFGASASSASAKGHASAASAMPKRLDAAAAATAADASAPAAVSPSSHARGCEKALNVDEVWLVPCGARPDKPSLNVDPFHRVMATMLAVEEAFPTDFRVKVMPWELYEPMALPS